MTSHRQSADPPGASPSKPRNPGQAPLVDVDEALSQFGGSSARLLPLLQGFIKRYSSVAQDIRHRLATGEVGQARVLLHTISGVAGNLRLKRLWEDALELQRVVQAEGPAPADAPQLARFGQTLADTVAAIERLLRSQSEEPQPALSPNTELQSMTRSLVEQVAKAHYAAARVTLANIRDRLEQTEGDPKPPAPSGNAPPPQGYETSAGSGRARVLVVDDEPLNRLLLRGALEKEGHHVIEATSGDEALQLLEAQDVDAILLDVVMPGLDGFAVCRQLKQSPRTQTVPVLLVTALEDRADRLRGIASGAIDFIHKPLDVDEVSLRVKNAVQSKKTYDELRHNYAKLQRAEELRDNLTHMLVHDLRTPLTSIIGYIHILSKIGAARNEDEALYLSRLKGISATLVEMVSSILDVSRLEAGELSLQCETTCLFELSEAVVEGLGGDQSKPVVVEGDRELAVSCDPALLQRVLTNLVANALKYSRDGGLTRVVVGAQGDFAEVRVIDRGPGISAPDRERVFDKFVQTETGRRHRHSTGLGLTFCKLAVEEHGGRIGVDSAVGQGSEFWFLLPHTSACPVGPGTIVAPCEKPVR